MDDILTIIYAILGGIIFLGFMITLFILAGKDIIFNIRRRLQPKGCDVFIVNHNRKVSQYYLIPKDGIFKVNDKPYITNPEKVISISPEYLEPAKEGIKKRKQNIEDRIKKINTRLKAIEKEAEAIKDLDGKEKDILKLKSEYNSLYEKGKILERKLTEREQVYYHKRRATFFFIEGDPIPKDFHELYTELDAIMLDNFVARSMTKDPRAIKDLEATLKMQKYVTIGLIIVGIVLIWFLFQNNSMLKSILDNLSIPFTI